MSTLGSRGVPVNVGFRPIADIQQTAHPLRVTAYADVDGVIDAWVKTTGSTLFTEWADKPARFFHVPGASPFECFQVSIDPPSAGSVAVLARSIDTNDDSEWEQTWEGPIDGLDAMLAAAVETIEMWKQRPQVARD